MLAEEYRKMLSDIGITQTKAAELLGVDRRTIVRRVTGALPIHREAELAIKYLKLQTHVGYGI